MTYFFDNNLSPKIAKILDIMDVDAIHLRDRFDPSTPDEEWLREAGKCGWVVVTLDKKIRSRVAEREAYKQYGVVLVVIYEKYMRLPKWNQIVWMLTRWPKIEEAVKEARQGTCLRVPCRGRIRRES